MAQTPAPASIHGKVTNPAGFPIVKGDVKLTTDKTGEAKDRKYKYSFPIDAQGNYKGDGIVPGDYLAVVMVDDKTIDFIESAQLKSGADFEGNFDMTRKEYIDKMTPEEKKQLEEFKKKNAETMAANSKIANLNGLLATARGDIKSGDFDGAIKAMTDATTAKPDEAILWLTLGDAQLGSGSAAQAAARTAHTSPMDAAIVEKFTAAAASYQKAIDANTASKKPNAETGATAYNQLGQALGRSGKTKESGEAYDNAAKADPAGAGKYLYNEAATLFNAGDMDGAAAAADKAIAADPKRPDIYYIKGQSLVSKATVDPKTQKIVAPPGCIEAYQTYLQLAPDGPHAADVKQVLDGFGAKIESSYKANTKKK
ncbi:carboxypeptidase regulatory-like domain-containing protein [Granulicella sp. WH15]|nr:carboxypeptidase regulatory-like domain-containing protein [Granulicella sp. WH15]